MRTLLGPSSTAGDELDDDDLARLVGAEARVRSGRPWVITNMVASLDGAIAVGGVSRGLSSPADRLLFSVLRAQADVVLVGAGTARAEGYHMPREPQGELGDQRRARGQRPAPALAVVSASLRLDGVPFVEAARPDDCVLITTSNAPVAPRRAYEMSCTVVDAGADAVDVTTALDALGALGHRVVLCEGGPTLLSGLTAADVVDEWNQTIAPVLVGGAMQMMLAAAPAVHPWALDRVLVDGGHVFTRYLRQPRSEAGITSR